MRSFKRVFGLGAAVAAFALAILFYPSGEQQVRAQANLRYDEVQSFQIKVGGKERTFGLYVPATYSKAKAAPLIVALHGRFASAKSLHALSQLQAVADRRGAILLYPETQRPFWSDGGHVALDRKEPELDDAGFIAELMAAIMANHTIDRSQVFLVGHEGGGGMALKLACQPPLPFAGVAIVSALMWKFTADACESTKQPTSLLFVHGRDSELFPVGGTAAQPPLNSARLSVNETLRFWQAANNCPQQASSNTEGAVIYTNCASGKKLAYVGIPGAQQTWVHDNAGYRLNKHEADTAAILDAFFFEQRLPVTTSARRPTEQPRDYIVYAPPSYDARKQTPVMVMLHGRPSNAAAMARITDMNTVAARHGFIVVYPEGLNNEWNAQFDLYNKSSRSVHTSGNEKVGLKQDDVGFLKTLMLDLALDFNIDPKRLYISGFSNGGFMTIRMACSASDTFAAFAEVGAAIYTILADHCRGSEPSPMLFMHGTLDPSIPIDGVRVRDSQSGMPTRVTMSVKETVSLFAKRNGCSNIGVNTTFSESGRSPGTHVERFTPKGCLTSAPVIFYIIVGGGHTWPGVPGILDEQQFGKTNLDIHASETIWEFVSAQRLGR